MKLQNPVTFEKCEKMWPMKRAFLDDDMPCVDYLVEMVAIESGMKIVELVKARTGEEAVANAFFTRNIASSWIVTEVERIEQ